VERERREKITPKARGGAQKGDQLLDVDFCATTKRWPPFHSCMYSGKKRNGKGDKNSLVNNKQGRKE
jgi:hypothetical protein